MAKGRKLTAEQKKLKREAKAERLKKYKWVMMNGKQVRVKREPTIDGISVDEFIQRNADPLFLHQNEMWEHMQNEDEACALKTANDDGEAMYFTLKIELVSGLYAFDDWGCEIEVDQKMTLNELHEVIIDLVNFDDDHLYDFFISRREFGSSRVSFDDESSLDTEVYGLFPLPKGRKLFYWFDFGADWKFQISKSRMAPKPFKEGVKYPNLVKELGEKPEQYAEADW